MLPTSSRGWERSPNEQNKTKKTNEQKALSLAKILNEFALYPCLMPLSEEGLKQKKAKENNSYIILWSTDSYKNHFIEYKALSRCFISLFVSL